MDFQYTIRFPSSSSAMRILSKTVNDVNSGLPSLIRRVWRISLGITTRPRLSTLLTIPVAFIFYNLFFVIITINLTLNINILIDFVFSSRMILKNDFYNKSSVFYHVFGIYRTFIFRCLSLHNTFYLLGCMVNLLVFVCPAPGRIMCSSFLHNPLSALPCLALLVSLKSCRL